MCMCIKMVMALWLTYAYHANVTLSAYADISVGIISCWSVEIALYL